MKIFYEKKEIEIKVDKVSVVGKFVGLMFKSKETKNLLFEFSYSDFPTIHSVFVFFPFLAIWLDKNDRVVDLCIVKPFSLSVRPKLPSRKLVEIPLNGRNSRTIQLLVGKRKDLNI